jgi:hypothetical protein
MFRAAVGPMLLSASIAIVFQFASMVLHLQQDLAQEISIPDSDRVDQTDAVTARIDSTDSISVTLHETVIEWHGSANTLVSVNVYIDGFREAFAPSQRSNEEGISFLEITLVPDCTLCLSPREWLDANNVVEVETQGSETYRLVLPSMDADLDFGRDLVGGYGPRNQEIEVALRRNGQLGNSTKRAVKINENGRFLLDFSESWDAEFSDKAILILSDEDDNVIQKRFKAPQLRIELGELLGCAQDHRRFLKTKFLDSPGNHRLSSCDGGQDRVQAGDRIVVERGDSYLVEGADTTIELSVPSLDVQVNAITGEITGISDANLTLDLQVSNALGESLRRTVVTDSQGRFSIESGGAPLASTNIEIELDGRNGLVVVKRSVSRSVFIGLSNEVVTAHLGGRSDSEADFLSVSILDPQGEQVGSTSFSASDSGLTGRRPEWQEDTWRGGLEASDPGDEVYPKKAQSLEIAWGEESPKRLAFPPIERRVLPTKRAIDGQTESNAIVMLSFAGESIFDVKRPALRTVSDSKGVFSFDLTSEALELNPGDWGLVVVWHPNEKIAFYETWSIPEYRLNLTTGLLSAYDGLGMTLEIETKNTEGEIVNRVTQNSGYRLSLGPNPKVPLRPWWSVRTIVHEQQSWVELGRGWEISVDTTSRGSDIIVVPKLILLPDIDTDTIFGSSDFSIESIELSLSSPRTGDPRFKNRKLRQIFPQPLGQDFILSVSDSFDLRPGDAIAMRARAFHGVEFERIHQIPLFVLDPDTGWLSGEAATIFPGSAILVRHSRDGQVLGEHRGEIGSYKYAAFLVRIQDTNHRPISFEPGDILDVDIEASTRSTYRFVLPDLKTSIDWESASVSGVLSPVGFIEITSGIDTSIPQLDDSGRFEIGLVPQEAIRQWLRPGRRVQISAYLGNGLQMQRSLIRPIFSLEHSGRRIEAKLNAFSVLSAEVLDAHGNVISNGSTVAPDYIHETFDGDELHNTFLELKKTADFSSLEAGHVVRLSVNKESLDEIVVPDIELAADWADGQIIGKVEQGSALSYSKASDRKCTPEPWFSWESPRYTRSRRSVDAFVDADGEFLLPFAESLGGDLDPGHQLRLENQVESGHWVYRTISKASSALEWRTSVVHGCARPRGLVSVELKEEGGIRKAYAETGTDASGHYVIALRDESNEPVSVYATDTLEVCSMAFCTTMSLATLPEATLGSQRLVVRKLGENQDAFVEFSPYHEFGVVPHPQLESLSRSVWYPWTLQTRADQDGSLEFTDTLPLDRRLPWRISDLREVRVWAKVAPGGFVVDRFTASRRSQIYLPLVYRE